MVDRMSELFGYQNTDDLTPPIKSMGKENRKENKNTTLPKELSKSDKAKSEGKIEKCRYRNYYDVNDTITTAQTTNPHDEDHPNYNRERIFEALERNAEIIYVINDGTDVLYVIISHEGGQNFARERPIYPGDIKTFYNVYELRLRSATGGTEYRVTEYEIDTGCCPKASPNYFTSAALDDIPGTSSGSRVGSNDNIPSSVFILLSNVTSSTNPTNFPATSQQMQIVSTSASDTGGGTGAQQVEITYLTTPAAGFKRKTEIVTMAGLTVVATVATDIYRIERFRVSRVGTSLFALGNISLQNTLGTITFERIDALTNVNRTAVHWVPQGYQCIITDITIGCSTAGGVIFILEETELDSSNNPVTLAQNQLEMSNQSVHINLSTPHVINNSVGKEMFFALVTKGRASNQQASGSFSFIDILL